MAHSLNARWTLPGPTSAYIIVRSTDAAAKGNRHRVPSATIIPALDGWLVSHEGTLQEIHDALEGPQPSPFAQLGSGRQARLKARLATAFRTGKLVALSEEATVFKRGTGPQKGLGERLRSTVAREQLRDLAEAMTEAEFLSWLTLHFGADIPATAYRRLRAALFDGSLPEPELRLVDGALEPYGHVAGYNRRERAILISRPLVRRAREDNNEAWKLLVILIEEYGHHVDNLLRTEYSKVGGDAPLDEGSRMAYSLLNLGWNEGQVRCEFARLMTPTGEVPLEVEFSGLTRAIERFLNQREQVRDEKHGDLEFFGAGHGSGRPGSYGHELIEAVLGETDFRPEEIQRVYFGNWLRDYSQLIDPKTIRRQGAPAWPKPLPSRDGLTRVLDVLARKRFGNTRDFKVTPQKLGVYRNEEHIDNPSGIADGRAIDPQFRGPCLPEELRVEPATLMKRYIRSSAPTGHRPARMHRVRDGETLESIALQNGLTWQELARHNFGTDIPQEVNQHLRAKVGCTRRTANGQNYIFTSKDEPGIIEIPGRAGSPGVEARYTALRYLSEQLQLAVREGRRSEGFRRLGNALHTLEDFFSHSNFVEVALVHAGAWVEPWVPARHGPRTPSHELPITTGKFGGLDTIASLSLGVAEGLLKESECIAGQPSAMTEIILILLDDYGYTQTHAALAGLSSQFRAIERRYPELATAVCRTVGGVVKSIAAGFGYVVRECGNLIDDAQTAFLEDPASNDPTHSQLSKDHDDHPLHALAAELAGEAVLDVGKKIQQAWAGQATAEEVVATASQYFVHPAHIRAGGGNTWVMDRVRAWIPGHRPLIARLGSRSWAVEWTRMKSAELNALMRKAERILEGLP